jgi:hypothetical protein
LEQAINLFSGLKVGYERTKCSLDLVEHFPSRESLRGIG